ncbi:hypothetical protein CHLRE_07g332025v5 [Chlamydomonas reinhardtii]|uniref:Uncharacterized protein n=1 Tax=Chlamydomonas reinhardtii TaxID=3055 RepID=A0A2K3DJY7_CHLRE|nr:uncharacterized protein CHLRE_07g332025v5 [Chlamydomonas reinhardtii]PNW80845.1 hypothetical protein CHLRE_07g332025v5 [Chlamydomonas reinhardtii]
MAGRHVREWMPASKPARCNQAEGTSSNRLSRQSARCTSLRPVLRTPLAEPEAPCAASAANERKAGGRPLGNAEFPRKAATLHI